MSISVYSAGSYWECMRSDAARLARLPVVFARPPSLLPLLGDDPNPATGLAAKDGLEFAGPS